MKHYIQLHLLVLLLAATALLGEVISIPSVGVVVWRTLFAAVAAGLWVKLVWKKALWPGGRMAGALLGVGVVVGLHWMLFFQSLKVSNISICLAGLATIPLFTAFTEPFFEKRRLRLFEILVGLVIMAGILVVAGSIDLRNRAGLAYALGSAALAAVFPVMNRRLVLSGGDPLTMVAWEMAGALAVSLAAVMALGGSATLFAWKGLDWLWLLILALLCTVFAHGFQIRLLKYLGAYTVNLAISFEPLYGILAAAWAFGEYKQLTTMFYVGLSAILVANVLHPVAVRLFRRRRSVLTEGSTLAPEPDPMYPLWVALSTAQHRADDLASPWESCSPEVQQAWEVLTRPENLNGLRHWYRDPDGMNPVARESSRKALEACIARNPENS